MTDALGRVLIEPVKRVAVYFRRLFLAFCIFFTALFMLVMYTPLSNMGAGGLVVEEDLRRADLIAVLGGGAYPNGVLSGGSTERLIRGLLLYADGYAPRIIFSGGSILDITEKVSDTVIESGDPATIDVVEAAIMGEFSEKLGIHPGSITVDPDSTNTYENLVGVRDFMERTGFATCLVVTSPTHMYRSYRIVKKLGMDCYPAPVADYTRYIGPGTGRIGLARAVLWEYAALVIYRLYDYI
jgi:uncharacterized SAM-binding protein YcdF (DUF218 family)